ncbi:MAG: class I SAM-dependent methyltransferase [Thiobacillaceae bacterium]|nr:class I SAM-dependent methyltransferase [Thiobacillaceae bacterium]
MVVLDAGHFDSKAREWDENPLFRERAGKIADAIRVGVPLARTMTALDYGSGSGLLAFALQDALGHITLQDSSAGMLAVAREKIAAQGVTHMTVRQADLSADALPDERYDLICSSMTLHHIPDTDRILATFRQLLQPGGWLAVADLDREDGSFHGPEVDVHHGFERDALRARTERAGFAEVRFETVFEIVKETERGPRAYPVFLMLARRPPGAV